jgi:predicted phosphodiesterase
MEATNAVHNREDKHILFFGDNHGRFDHIGEAVEKFKPRAIVLLGDIEAKRPLEEELSVVARMTGIWWIHGNHDTDQRASYDHLFNGKLAGRCLHGRVVNVAGVRIAGLGGVFRGKVWRPPESPKVASYDDLVRRLTRPKREANLLNGLLLTHRSTIFEDVYEKLADQRADVLVSHEAPSCHPHGFEAIDDLARQMGVHTVFHGHHHNSLGYSSQFERLGFKAFGVGFCGITRLDGESVSVARNKVIERQLTPDEKLALSHARRVVEGSDHEPQ